MVLCWYCKAKIDVDKLAGVETAIVESLSVGKQLRDSRTKMTEGVPEVEQNPKFVNRHEITCCPQNLQFSI